MAREGGDEMLGVAPVGVDRHRGKRGQSDLSFDDRPHHKGPDADRQLAEFGLGRAHGERQIGGGDQAHGATGGPSAVLARDLDGDGKPELVIAHDQTMVKVYRNTTVGTPQITGQPQPAQAELGGTAGFTVEGACGRVLRSAGRLDVER